METRNIESLQPNPNNEHSLSNEGKELLLHAMSLGDHGVFLITPEGMIINGNNRWHLRIEAHWDGKDVHCRILTVGQDGEGFYAIIDGIVIKEAEVIPHHYVSIEALYAAYAFTANGEAGYYKKSIIDKFAEWNLDPKKFAGSFFPPVSIAESLEKMKQREKKKKYEIVIACEDEAQMDTMYSNFITAGYRAKRKI